MIAVCGYGSLMNVSSFERTLSQAKSKNQVIFIPIRIRNIIFLEKNGQEIKYYAKRVFSHPRTKRSLTKKQIETNQRAVLTLELSTTPIKGAEYFNAVIGYNISDEQLEFLKEREHGYDLCKIKREDLLFIYDKYNRDFLAQAIFYYPEMRSNIEDIINLTFEKTDDYSHIRQKLENVDSEKVVEAIRSIMPEEILVFAEAPRTGYSINLVEKIISIGRAIMFPSTMDPQLIINNIYNEYKRIEGLQDIKKVVLSYVGNASTKELEDIITQLDLMTDNSEQFKAEFQQILKDKLKLNIGTSVDIKQILIILLSSVLDRIVREETTQVIRYTLTERFGVKLYPIQEYNDRILDFTFKLWGPDFVEDYLNTTFLIDGKKMSEFDDDPKVQKIKALLKEKPYDDVTNIFSSPWLDWIFTRNLRQSVNPAYVANKLLEEGVASAIAYCTFSHLKEKQQRDMERIIKIDQRLNCLKQINAFEFIDELFENIEEMVNPSMMETNFISLVYLDSYEMKVTSKNPKIKQVSTKFDLFLIIFSNGIISIIYRFSDFEKLIRTVPLSYILTWWTKLSEVKEVKIYPLNDKNDRSAELRFRRLFLAENNDISSAKNLSDLPRRLLERIREICNLTKEETTYHFGLNHPLLHFSINENLLRDASYKSIEDLYNNDNIREKIIRIITTKFRGPHRFISSNLENISPYSEFAIFTDFNSLILHKDPNYVIYYTKEINYLTLFFSYIMAARQSVLVAYYELDKLIKESPRIQHIDYFVKLQRKWIQYYSLLMPSRVLRNREEIMLAEKLFKIFRVDKNSEYIETQKSELDEFLSRRKMSSDEWAFLFINLLLSGSLAFDFTSQVLSHIITPTPLIFFLVWLIVSATIFIITRLVPRLYFKYTAMSD
ncbi:MAG: hypothetical protein ABGF52_09465 [Candidatus Asgardarchaeum sp.]